MMRTSCYFIVFLLCLLCIDPVWVHAVEFDQNTLGALVEKELSVHEYTNRTSEDERPTVEPTLVLDELGFKLKWTTLDESLASLRYVFEQEMPSVMERYDQIEALTDAELEELRNAVFDIRLAHFTTWGLSNALTKRSCPFFEGTYVRAMELFFSHERLGYSPEAVTAYRKEHSHNKYSWTGGLSQGLRNVRHAFSIHRPDILEKYDRFDELTADARAQLKAQVYAVKHGHFSLFGLESACLRDKAPYFEGSYITVLQRVFPKLELDRLQYDFDPETIDEVVAYAREQLRTHYPHIMAQYDKRQELSQGDLAALRNEIYALTRTKLLGLGFAKVFDSKHISDGYIGLLETIFDDIDLDPLGFSPRWRTKDEAIQSIRYYIRKARPDIMALVDRYATLSEIEREQLLSKIYMITQSDIEMWGLKSVLSGKQKELFQQSYVVALQEAFPDLELKRVGFVADWSTYDTARETLRFALTRELPYIMKQYAAIDQLSHEDIEKLRNSILWIQRDTFVLMRCEAAFSKAKAPYYNSDRAVILMGIFDDARLGLTADMFLQKPKVHTYKWGAENEDVAIANVYNAVKQHRPYLVECYENLDTVTGAVLRTAVEEEFYNIRQGHFPVWGLRTAINIKNAPYFEGSYIVALQKAFPKLALNRLGFEFFYETREESLKSMRWAFQKNAPALLERYDRFDELGPLERDQLREAVYALTQKVMKSWGLDAPFKVKKGYFDGTVFGAMHFLMPKLQLKRLGFGYVWGSYDNALESVRVAVIRHRPDVWARFMRISTLSPYEVEVLKKDIYAIDSTVMRSWGILEHTMKCGYFHSAADALMQVFNPSLRKVRLAEGGDTVKDGVAALTAA